MIPRLLVGADDDWIEGWRARVYPFVHPLARRLGAFATATTPRDEYVGAVAVDEAVLERELVGLGFRRNPVAAYKRLGTTGRRSEGSWVLLPEDSHRVDEGLQLHLTLFPSVVDGWIELYAHLEDDWRHRPLAHLRGTNLDRDAGVRLARRVLDDESFVTLHDRDGPPNGPQSARTGDEPTTVAGSPTNR